MRNNWFSLNTSMEGHTPVMHMTCEEWNASAILQLLALLNSPK